VEGGKVKREKYTPAHFLAACERWGLPEPQPEYRFHSSRRWRFDWTFPRKIAVEVVGGAFVSGRHSRGQGQIADMERLNTAQTLGWIVLQFTPRQILDGSFVAMVLAAQTRRQVEFCPHPDDRVTLPGTERIAAENVFNRTVGK